jgi:hypothetical protein
MTGMDKLNKALTDIQMYVATTNAKLASQAAQIATLQSGSGDDDTAVGAVADALEVAIGGAVAVAPATVTPS